MSDFNPDDIRKAALTPRWAALSQLGGVAADLHNYDRFLVREPRLLVPVDLQALVVRAGSNDTEPMLTLPFRDGKQELAPVALDDPGAPRPPGVHLLWSVPAALGRGTLVDDPQAPGDATRRQLALPVLPDRWVVVRLAVASGAAQPLVTGWVLEADAGTVTPLADWPAVQTSRTQVGPPIALEQLNVHAGGTSWTQCYDAAQGRFALHDPLADLAGVQLEGDAISYLVAGWWSVSADDPLDGVGTDAGYRRRLAQLGWNDPDHPSTDASRRDAADQRYLAATTFGLDAPQRYTQPLRPGAKTGAALSQATGSGQVAPQAEILRPAISGFLSDVVAGALLPPAPTRTTLLHGRLHGVPLNGAPAPDSRPAGDALRVVLGSATPDLAATIAASGTGLGSAGADAQRAAERLLAAFSGGLIMHIGEADAWADVAEYEHAHAYGSLPGGSEGIDRLVDKPGTAVDPGAGFRPGTAGIAPKPTKAIPAATILWSAVERPGTSAFTSIQKSPVTRAATQFDGRPRAVPPQAPAQTREVVRPAPAYHFPAPPVLAVAGGGRTPSAVEREEADGALICRLSDQVSQGHAGVLAASELLTSIGSAAVPDEVLELAREVLAEDPYLARWRAQRAGAKGFDPDVAANRFLAEAAVAHAYYAADNDRLGKYVGAEVASSAKRQQATEGLLRLSMSDGIWSHPEGVTMWGQPWRPMFCDWRVELDLAAIDAAPLEAWSLAGVDLDARTDPSPELPDSVTLSGRSPLVAGVARTLAAGIDRWLAEERQRDLGGHGLADPSTENALSALRDTLSQVDLMSVALDGIREQLLGLDYDRGLLHRDDDMLEDGTRRALAVALPRLLAAGKVALTDARLVDAFGRTLALPVDAVAIPERLSDDSGKAMLVRPRLTAPARWRFDLVDATSTADDAPLACIDQSDPSKQVNPVAGFLLPDHMDESLEVFATDGRPLGELLHDSFSDAVAWEIAPGRTDVAPAAGPTDDPDANHHRVGWIAAGLVAADAVDRGATPNRAETESALSAMLRAIDTTLWTVDPFGSLGTEHIAGLVGRPIAVVSARLSLDIQSDVEDRAYADEALRSGRSAAFDDLAAAGRRGAPRRGHPLRRRPAGLLRGRRLLALPRGRRGHRRPRTAQRARAGRPRSERRRPHQARADRQRVHRHERPAADPSGPDGPADPAHASGRQGPSVVGPPAAQQSRARARLGRAGPLGARAVGALRAAAHRRRQGAPAEGRVVPRRAALHPPRHPDVVEGRPDPGGDPVRAAPGHGAGGTGGLDQDRPEPGRRGGLMARYDWPAPPRGEDDPIGRERYVAVLRPTVDPTTIAPLKARARRRRKAAGAPLGDAPVGNQNLWFPIGPSVMTNGQAGGNPNVAGRIRDVQIDPTGGLRIYAASAGGGAWFSADRGETWSPLDDFQVSDRSDVGRVASALSCGAIYVKFGADADGSKDVVWVGTGEPSLFGGGQPGGVGGLPGGKLAGIGFLHRDPAVGPGWTIVKGEAASADPDTLRGARCYRIAADPGNLDQLVAGTTNGLYLLPAGGSWARVVSYPAAAGHPLDVVLTRLTGPDRVRIWVGVPSGVRVAEFAGTPATAINPASLAFSAVALPNVNMNAPPAGGGTRVQLATDGSKVYVLGRRAIAAGEKRSTPPADLWSIDATAALASLGATEITGLPLDLFMSAGDQSDYDMCIAAHPTTAGRIYVGGAAVSTSTGWNGAFYRCEIAGTTATPTLIGEGVHSDVHIVRIGPAAPGQPGQRTVWVGCDGGLFRSDADGDAGTFSNRNDGLAVLQPGYVASHPTNPGIVAAGFQDNGTAVRTGDALWEQRFQGDGGGIVFDPASDNRYFRQYTQATWHSSDGGAIAPVHRRNASAQGTLKTSETIEGDSSLFYSGADAVSLGGDVHLAIGSDRVWYTRDWGRSWVTLPTATDPRAGDNPNLGQDVLQTVGTPGTFSDRVGSNDSCASTYVGTAISGSGHHRREVRRGAERRGRQPRPAGPGALPVRPRVVHRHAGAGGERRLLVGAPRHLRPAGDPRPQPGYRGDRRLGRQPAGVPPGARQRQRRRGARPGARDARLLLRHDDRRQHPDQRRAECAARHPLVLRRHRQVASDRPADHPCQRDVERHAAERHPRHGAGARRRRRSRRPEHGLRRHECRGGQGHPHDRRAPPAHRPTPGRGSSSSTACPRRRCRTCRSAATGASTCCASPCSHAGCGRPTSATRPRAR